MGRKGLKNDCIFVVPKKRGEWGKGEEIGKGAGFCGVIRR